MILWWNFAHCPRSSKKVNSGYNLREWVTFINNFIGDDDHYIEFYFSWFLFCYIYSSCFNWFWFIKKVVTGSQRKSPRWVSVRRRRKKIKLLLLFSRWLSLLSNDQLSRKMVPFLIICHQQKQKRWSLANGKQSVMISGLG